MLTDLSYLLYVTHTFDLILLCLNYSISYYLTKKQNEQIYNVAGVMMCISGGVRILVLLTSGMCHP